ncbi:MAG: hypothetical protein AUI64_04810 [Acidobacteria bacterium 13_1_40CM_2_64_6]|nr:MAG: hypothetical protein AUI64_04810 [Acidobacteria bacterium 13_1_40CM_2_64_6]
MSSAERIEALKGLGYTEREAAFLCLAALHGGYFLRRQYCDFIGKQIGGTAAALVEKLLAQRHAVAISALNNTKLYHLGCRPFYAVLGETDNRNRREHSPLAIKRRLMGLDFVLAHPNYRYLATEREKVDYFSGTLGIALSALPYKRYLSLKTPSTTTRYFVDKFPIFLGETSPTEPRSTANFCFVDEGSLTLSGFETYLGQYSALWLLLKGFQVIYVAETKRLYPAAERRFTAFQSQLKSSDYDPDARLAKRVIEHFEARFLYEKGDLGSFSRDKLIRLRNERVEFSEPKHQALYERWKAAGTPAVLHVMAPNVRLPLSPNATFSTCLVEQSYEFLGKNQPPE